MSTAWSVARTVMASSKETRKVLEGVFAINKPQWASSAGVLRDLQTHFQPSPVFAPFLDSERRKMITSSAKKNKVDKLKVKLGHGGTLDPMATGVLIVGVGKGTKCLSRFLECTKSYECVVLFGAATDSYDAVGKVVSRAPYEHVTKELVEEKLEQFRGKIMQKPSVFSALKVDGKKMYEYAREGNEIPEVAARPVEVKELELVEWLEPGTHEYTWPKEEIEGEEKTGAEKLIGIRPENRNKNKTNTHERPGLKRNREPEDDHDDDITNSSSHPKKPKTDDEPAMSGALPIESEPEPEKPSPGPQQTTLPESTTTQSESITTQPETTATQSTPSPPAARLRMTVTSGFYVRSLCHDLGLSCSSLGLMSSLVRTRQGDYDISSPSTLTYADLESPEVWEPKVRDAMTEFMEKEGWEVEEIESQEAWEEGRKKGGQGQGQGQRQGQGNRREGDRRDGKRNFRGGGGRGGKGETGGRGGWGKDKNWR